MVNERGALITLLSATLALGISACTSAESPTAPGSAGDRPPATPASFASTSNSWTSKAALPIGLTRLAAGMAFNSAGQSVVYVFGGEDWERTIGRSVLSYNVVTNTWAYQRSSVRVSRVNGVGKIGSRMYFSGGLYGGEALYSSELYAYDYGADRMIRKASMPKHTGDGVTGVINGKLYVLPGTCSTEDGSCALEPIRQLYRYDPVTNSWINRPSSPHFHKNGAAGVIDGKLYVAGGFNGLKPVADLDVYDPATNSWKTLARMPAGGRAIGTVQGGRFFVITSGMYAYDPGTNTWTTKAAPRWSHDALVWIIRNGRVFLLAVGGTHGVRGDIPNPTELYTP
jgi:N-acetylneuraminic acid mutarotase